jgi:aldehyde:ferredoxin oxidoreductase
MRKYLHIDLNNRSIEAEERSGEDVVRAGRNYIVKTLLEKNVAQADPLGPDNPLIISAGPFAGSNFSNANRVSVGCKSPLTGGVKEANSGGTFAFALGQLELAGLTLNGQSDDWVVIRIPKDGDITFEDASPYMGKGNIEVAAQLFEKYGKKISIGLCGPVGEYQGMLSGICFTDPEGRPARIAARGGVGAVMGSKKVKAIVVDMHKMPPFHDRKKFMGSLKEYGKLLGEDQAIKAFSTFGTAMVTDVTNTVGGLPTRNFSSGQLVGADDDAQLKLSGTYIRDLNESRGGETTHACMPGCLIKCSNVYVDENGEELVSPLEYETIGLMGSNCGLTDPDDVARLNHVANDLGVDTIETGAMLGVLMEAGVGEFGDHAYMHRELEEIRNGTERGKFLAQGTAAVGKHYKVDRIPVIKNQGISAYDPRVIEVTGISMMLSAQGADHTVGNAPTYKCADKTTEHLVEASLELQINCAAADSLGLCIFGRSVTNEVHELIITALNDAQGTDLAPEFIADLGRETIRLEWEFNRQAGFTFDDDEVPDFFYNEPLSPSDKIQRHTSAEINKHLRTLLGGDREATL